MKKLLQKILSMAIVVTILCPSIGSASGLSDGLKIVGGGIGVVSGVLWYLQVQEVTDCENAGSSCSNLGTLKDTATFQGAISLLGFGAMGLGFILDDKNAFQTRRIPNGIAIERDGVSFSATNAGQMKLQKRWEF